MLNTDDMSIMYLMTIILTRTNSNRQEQETPKLFLIQTGINHT